MRVLMFSWEYPPFVKGGMGEHVKELVPALLAADAGLELHLLTPAFAGDTSRERLGALTVHRVRVEEPGTERFYQQVLSDNNPLEREAEAIFHAAGGFDFMHVHDWLVSFAALDLQRLEHVPLLTTIHATERGRYRGGLYNDLSRAIDGAERQLAQRSQRIITCSRAMRQEVEDYFGIQPQVIRTIPNGIDASRFDAPIGEDHTRFRAGYARPDEKIVFNVGRLVYEKGADLLVEAAPRVLQQVPEAKFVIAGRGPMLPALQQRVREMHLTDKILLTGYLKDEDRDRLYVTADCCAFPSRYEPFGIVALESMAAGTPVVVSDVGGLGTVVNHGETGLTTYPENIESLAWGIVETLRHPNEAAVRARAARASVRQSLSWPIIAGMTLQVYRELVDLREAVVVR